jgi:hypothetical protein
VVSDKLEWTVPAKFLNPGTTYHWRVRARNSRGDIGDWGPAFAFSYGRSAWNRMLKFRIEIETLKA